MSTLILAQPWGRYEAGTELHVLAPTEEIRPGAIDAQRAAQLERDGYTRPAAAPPKPKRRGRGKGE